MCSIMGYCSRSISFYDFMKGFEKTKSRGPDDSRVVKTEKGILGFHRLSIMGLTPSGMQPFQYGKNYVVCNGEIYGFEKLKKELSDKYTFESDSDCEILLPLYQEYGTDMFLCWMQSLPVSFMMVKQKNSLLQEILLELDHYIMAMTKKELLFLPVNPKI